MSLLKQKVTPDSKSNRKPTTYRNGGTQASGLSDKKNNPYKMGQTPKKDSSNTKGNYAAWSGKKRLAVVRDEQNSTANRSSNNDGQNPGQNADSNQENRADNDHVRQYGFSQLISRHKSSHAEANSRGNSEYYFKRNDREYQNTRLASPELLTTRHKKSAYEVSDNSIRRISVEEAAKENSVNKNNLQPKQTNQEELASIRSLSTINKKIETMSTIQPNNEDRVDTRLGATIKIIGSSSNQLTINGRPVVLDIRSSTTLTRQIVTSPEHTEKQKQHYPVKEIKRSTSNAGVKIPQSTLVAVTPQVNDGKSICTRADHSTFSQLEQEHSSLKIKFNRYEKALSDKQKDISKLELQNHNIKVEMKNLQSKLSEIQGQKSKITHIHASSQSCLDQLRKQIMQLRKQAGSLRNKHAQDLAKTEKDAREQYGQLIHEKNNQIAKLNLFIREKDADINAIKQEINRHIIEADKASAKLTEIERLADYYKKQTKGLGIQLFNVKKKLENQARERNDLQSKLNQITLKSEYFSNRIADLERIIKGKDTELNEKLKQSQHEKNLLYDSMSNSTKLKDQQILNLRKELATIKQQSLSPRPITPNHNQLANKQLIDSLRRQLQQTTNDLKATKINLSKEITQKQRILIQKKQLTSSFQEKQRKEDEQKLKIYQSQSIKSFDTVTKPPPPRSDMDKLIQELNLKNIEIANLGKSLKGIQQRYSAQQSLLSSTNEELLTLRVQGLAKKLQNY